MEVKEQAEHVILFHNDICMSSKNLVVPPLLPIINSSIPLFIHLTGNVLRQETIETHREITNAIADHNPNWAYDAMYLHLVYNRRLINLAKEKQVQERKL